MIGGPGGAVPPPAGSNGTFVPGGSGVSVDPNGGAITGDPNTGGGAGTGASSQVTGQLIQPPTVVPPPATIEPLGAVGATP